MDLQDTKLLANPLIVTLDFILVGYDFIVRIFTSSQDLMNAN